VPDEDYPSLKLIFDLAMSGRSYDAIIVELKRRGIASPSGNDTWNKYTISSILRNSVSSLLYHLFWLGKEYVLLAIKNHWM
jgi:hypothetical protein